MLIRFEATNHRSIRSPVELSMVAVDRERDGVREVPLLGESLLPVAAIYGPNASGKSNVVAALAWVRDAVRDSSRRWEDEIPVEPFAFEAVEGGKSWFTLELTVDGVRFEYALELSQERISYEGLFHYPEKKRRRIFERENIEGKDQLKLQRGLGHLSGTRDLISPKSLALSVARRFEDSLVSRFARKVLDIQTLGPRTQRSNRFPAHRRNPTLRWFDQVEDEQPTLFPDAGESSSAYGDRDQALKLLKLADLGIEDVVIEDKDLLGPGSLEPRKIRRVSLLHRTGTTSAPLDFELESEGTRAWFDLIGPILTALRRGTVLVVDELDASLHPKLSAELLRIFHDPAINKNGAQLIFTSHDTSLLATLNRDEVWFTEKRPDGSTRLGALAEFAGERVRRSKNLETAYLHGRFGALPQVDQVELFRALGLIG